MVHDQENDELIVGFTLLPESDDEHDSSLSAARTCEFCELNGSTHRAYFREMQQPFILPRSLQACTDCTNLLLNRDATEIGRVIFTPDSLWPDDPDMPSYIFNALDAVKPL